MPGEQSYSDTAMTTPTDHHLSPHAAGDDPTTVAVVTLGCARNEVDSEELAGRLEAGGFRLVEQPGDAETVVVNTCGFVEAAKKDSVDTLLAAADLKDGTGPTKAVVAVGCLAERYGKDLAASILAGEHHEAHTPTDRRRLLPVSPAERGARVADVVVPGHVVAAPDLDAGVAPASGPRA